MLFLAENLLNFVRYGGGVPPHSVNFFPLVFRKNFVRYGGGEYPPFPLTFFAKFSRPLSRGGRGGTPLADKFRDSGFWILPLVQVKTFTLISDMQVESLCTNDGEICWTKCRLGLAWVGARSGKWWGPLQWDDTGWLSKKQIFSSQGRFHLTTESNIVS